MKQLWLLLAILAPLQPIHAPKEAVERFKREPAFTLTVLAIALVLVLCVLYAIICRYRK